MTKKSPLPEELYKLLACPVCKHPVKYSKNKKTLVCSECEEEYKIEQGIPILLPKEK